MKWRAKPIICVWLSCVVFLSSVFVNVSSHPWFRFCYWIRLMTIPHKSNCMLRTGIAQLVERSIEMSGTILTRVRVPGAARDFSPRVSFQCRLCTCPHASTYVCTLKIPNTGSHVHHYLERGIYHTHWQERVAQLLRLLCLTHVKRPEVLARNKKSTKKQM